MPKPRARPATPPQPQPPPSVGPALPEPAAAPPLTIHLLGRHACVTPGTRGLARAEGGFIDVANPKTDTLVVTMTGSAAANSYLGTTGSATETFQLVQDIEITSAGPRVQRVVLALDSALVGMLRARRKASAGVEVASISILPAGCTNCPPLGVAPPPARVEGTAGELCNQHLAPYRTPPLPLGRYTLAATFVLDTTGSGVCDAHAVADFSPDTSQPDDWVRVRDPFQGVAKRAFGFTTTISAQPFE